MTDATVSQGKTFVSRSGALAIWLGRRDGGFRVFGYGLSWKDTRVVHQLWSEREHVHRQLRIGPWLIKPLKRGAIGFARNHDR